MGNLIKERKMMKKIRSRIGAAMMAAALTLTMSQPVILNAAESPADESSAEVQQIVPETESDVVVGDETQGDVLQDTADAKPEDKNNALRCTHGPGGTGPSQ